MKTKSVLLPVLALFAGLFVSSMLHAAATPSGELIAPADNDAAWLTAARAAYPLKTCLISEEELGGMGAPVEFIYRQPGQADQLVRFCCKMCVRKFKKDPAKYLAQLKAGAKSDAHPHH